MTAAEFQRRTKLDCGFSFHPVAVVEACFERRARLSCCPVINILELQTNLRAAAMTGLMMFEISVTGDSPEEVIMVGDTEYDLEMARNAGVASVGVSFGVHSVERLADHAPLAIIDTLPELLDLPELAAR
mgnify:CR=1 FL=1